MTLAAWLTLLSAWVVAVASPGPDFLAVLRTAASSGRRRGMLVAAGVATGIGVWVTLALTGLSVVFAHYEAAYLAVRYLGAAFLIAYGAFIVWKTRGPASGMDAVDDVECSGRESGDDGVRTPGMEGRRAAASKAFRLGLFTNLANPKALVFFGALLASLVPHGASAVTQFEVFAGIIGVALAWFTTVALVASTSRVASGYQRASRRIDRVVGTLFAGVGISLVAAG